MANRLSGLLTLGALATGIIAALMSDQAPFSGLTAPQPTTQPYPAGCAEKYCPPYWYQIPVDKAQNTVSTDLSLNRGLGEVMGLPSLQQVYETSKARFVDEAANHAGVLLVRDYIV